MTTNREDFLKTWTEKPFAFPLVTAMGGEIFLDRGMTLRDYFAGEVIARLAVRPTARTPDSPMSQNVMDNIAFEARIAYLYADAMLAERERRGGTLKIETGGKDG
jgi:hypothetical protein